MNSLLLKAAPYALAAAFGFGLAWQIQGIRVDSVENDLQAYKNTVAEQTSKAAAHNALVEKQNHDNLLRLKGEYETQIPRIRSDAVAAYRLRYPNGNGSTLPASGTSLKVDDGTSQKCVDDTFIADAAEDAAKVEAWRRYGELNNLPVE